MTDKLAHSITGFRKSHGTQHFIRLYDSGELVF